MNELTDQSIESRIISLLKSKTLPPVEIVSAVQRVRPNTPKQSVYLAIRKLKKKEVVAISGKKVSLHQIWISKMKSFFNEANTKPSQSREVPLVDLQEKESITYKFNSLLSLDMFWGHAFAVFMNSLTKGDSIYLYNPHEWFLIVREASEGQLIRDAKKLGISLILLLGGKTPLDTQARNYFDGKHARCHAVGKDVFEKNYYVNCFNEFLIEVWLDKRVVGEIEKIYANHTKVTEKLIDELKEIIEDKQYIHKMKISKNSSKASEIKNKFKKYFIV